ncbi:shikimate dehydrogenase family protein [Rasiella sp. SM2506]|uniref:shikimate dehydrogenase family protein n=1 Tax=Rasiella sp. SM2506 TaxID=3423914 RepID=UPI003D7A8395
MSRFGLLGKNIEYSFSKTFFSVKFENESLPHTYHNFDMSCIENFDNFIANNPDIKGMNVTIPYKEEIIPYLFRLDKESKKIGAVNTIKFRKDGKLIGYNTDHFGFATALAAFLPIKEKTALILGTGGASKAIIYVLDAMGFQYQSVSRYPKGAILGYHQLTKEIIKNHYLIINCTPLGTFPNIQEVPNIPYNYIGEDHVLFDLIYNPRETEFMKRGAANGARVSNGFTMLKHQALKSWAIWNR